MNVPPPSNPARSRSIGPMPSSWGGLSSLLRPAATERRAASQRSGLWAGMAHALRAAGPDPRSRPLHAVLAGGDCLNSQL